MALHHTGNLSKLTTEEFDDLEDDVLRGAAQCLRFLADALKSESGQPESAQETLKPPLVEKRLAEKLSVMTSLLRAAGYTWTWDVDIGQSRLDGMFLVIGSSRSNTARQSPFYMVQVPGFHIVLQREQREAMQNLSGRVKVLQDLLFSDTTVVADVVVSTRQSAALTVIPGDVEEVEESEKTVEHSLRLEMVFSRTGRFSDEGLPILTSSPWVISDWNWVCLGNHPVLSRPSHHDGEPKRDL